MDDSEGFYLMISFVVNLHGAQGTRGEAAAGNVAAERRLTAVSVQVFAQVDHVLTPCKHNIECVSGEEKKMKCRSVQLSFTPVFAVITAVWFLVAVAEFYVVAQSGRRRAGHVTQRAFVVAHCAIKKKTEQRRD